MGGDGWPGLRMWFNASDACVMSLVVRVSYSVGVCSRCVRNVYLVLVSCPKKEEVGWAVLRLWLNMAVGGMLS